MVLVKRRMLFLVIIVILLLIIIANWITPHYYEYNGIPALANCDKDFAQSQKYILFPMVTITWNLGLGNQIFEVSSLLGLAHTLNRTAIFNADDWVLHSNLDVLQKNVPRIVERVISIPIVPSEATRFSYSVACCHYQFASILSCEQSKFLVIQGRYFQSFKYFSSIESSIRKWLKPPSSEEVALKNSVKKKDELRFKTCVHVRRKDFVNDGVHAGTNQAFTIRAIDYLYTINPGLIFIFSDDPEWVRVNIFGNLDYQYDVKIMQTPNNEAIKDLYFSQIYCDSVLITAPSSSFAWWLGYLSKNQSNVFYRDIRETEDNVKRQMVEEDFFPSSWKKLGMTRNGLIVPK